MSRIISRDNLYEELAFSIRDCWVLVNDEWGGYWSSTVQPRGRFASELDTLLSIINGLSLIPGETNG